MKHPHHAQAGTNTNTGNQLDARPSQGHQMQAESAAASSRATLHAYGEQDPD